MTTDLTEKLAELIFRHPEFSPADPCFVSVYRCQRCYGGPEEGGWWYDRNVLEGSIGMADRPKAERLLSQMKAEVEAQNAAEAPERWRAMEALPDEESCWSPEGFIPFGWSDGGSLWITIEAEKGQSDNSTEPRPYYS